MLLKFLLLPAMIAAHTHVVRDPCKCGQNSLFENASIWDRKDCCSAWTLRPVTQEFETVAMVVYQRIADTAQFQRYSDAILQQVDFPGEDAVLNDENNQYTNYTCRGFACRRVVINGTPGPGDDQLPLCHNSTAPVCVVWVPIPPLTGGPWLVALVGLISVLGILDCFYTLLAACAVDSHDLLAVLILWVYVFALSQITIPVVCRFDEWLAHTQVDRGYLTYQTCIRDCALESDKYQMLAELNQCADRGVSCDGIPANERLGPCRGCRAHTGDWNLAVMYVGFVKCAILAHWAALVGFTVSRRTASMCGMLCAANLIVCVAWLTLTLTWMSWCGVYGLGEYSSPFGSHTLWATGMSWSVCGIVWSVLFGLSHVMAEGRREMECVNRVRVELVFN